MAHLKLHHFAAQHPHTVRMRKREDRKLRAVRPSRSNERWYRDRLLEVVAHLEKAGADLATDLEPRWKERESMLSRDGALDDVSRLRTARAYDTAVPNLDDLIKRLENRFGNIADVAKRLSAVAARNNRGAVDERLASSIYRSLGVDIRPTLQGEGPIAEAMDAAIQANVDLIVSIPRDYLDQVRGVVQKAWTDGVRHEDLIARIARIGQITQGRAKTIARDQTAKMNSSFNQVRQTSLGIERYEWVDSRLGRPRERDSHAAMRGTIQRWDKPPIVDGEPVHPGQAINCMCVAIPIVNLDEIAADATGETNVLGLAVAA